MNHSKKIAAIIAAAGMGSRMNSSIPKQYIKIGGKPMLIKTAEAFQTISIGESTIDPIIITVNQALREETAGLLKTYGIRALLVNGGKERQDSVYAALKALPPDTDYVIIHDGARPYVSKDLIQNTVEAAFEHMAATCAVPVKDTIRMEQDQGYITLDRASLYAIQTPQAFEKNLLLRAYESAFTKGFYGTDDAALTERIGVSAKIVPGDYRNIKITTREDLPLNPEPRIRIGTGFDVHAFCKQRQLILGGVPVPSDLGLSGHSDADVLVHAIIDALLGAAAIGDIGTLFPDSDERYKGISSLILLEETGRHIAQKGFSIGNIDAVLIAERPKIAPYREKMIAAISKVLQIEEKNVHIKGTTTEKLGFAGREEGIGAQAVCMIYKEN